MRHSARIFPSKLGPVAWLEFLLRVTARPSLLTILSQRGFLKPDLVATLINELGRSGKLARLESQLNPSDDQHPAANQGAMVRSVAATAEPGGEILRGRRDLEGGLKDSGRQPLPESASPGGAVDEAAADTVLEPGGPGSVPPPSPDKVAPYRRPPPPS